MSANATVLEAVVVVSGTVYASDSFVPFCIVGIVSVLTVCPLTVQTADTPETGAVRPAMVALTSIDWPT